MTSAAPPLLRHCLDACPFLPLLNPSPTEHQNSTRSTQRYPGGARNPQGSRPIHPSGIMQFGSAVGTACASFAITNIDDLFVLVTFFAEASSSHSLTPLKITIGQFLGFTVIIVVSMIGFGASLALPSEPIGFLGLLPILLGVWKVAELFLPDDDDDEEGGQSRIPGMKSVLKVATVTVMNGGDNIGTYVPLFSQAQGAEIAVYVVVYYILLGLWCLVAFLIMKQRHIMAVAEKYARYIVPLLYVGLGIYIIVKSECYPWAIEHIDDKYPSSNPGTAIMAVSTVVLLIVCMGCMLWLTVRKRKAAAASRLAAANPEVTEGSEPPGNAPGTAAEPAVEIPPNEQGMGEDPGSPTHPRLRRRAQFSLLKKGLLDVELQTQPPSQTTTPMSEKGAGQ